MEYYYIWKKMIKFDCGRAPGLEKRLKREAEDVDRTDAKVEGRGVWVLTTHPSWDWSREGSLQRTVSPGSLWLPGKGGGSAH